MKRSYKSPLTAGVREAEAARREAVARGIPLDEVTGERAERAQKGSTARRERLSRRDILGLAIGGAGLALGPRRAAAAGGPRVVIVGAGLAGLRCAHMLWINWGWVSTIYEWSARPGGRVETLRGYFNNGQAVEAHGEFISSEHASMLALATRYNLQLDIASTVAAYPPGTNNIYWFNGGYYTQAQLNNDWWNFGWNLFHGAVSKAPWPTRYNNNPSQSAINWDHMSVVDWINQYVPGGMAGDFGKLCYQDVISEYGGAPEQQSALNLIYILGYDDSSTNGRGNQPKSYPVLAGTDEKYHITGGNDQIVAGMVNELPSGTIQYGYQLTAIARNADGSYNVTFQNGLTVTCDHVVLTIPFNKLRNVDLSKANLSPLKMTAINNLNLGTNAKIYLQFKSRVWNALGFNGNSYADNGSAIVWECTNYQLGPTGILIDFPGGAQGAALPSKYGLTADSGVAPAQLVADILATLEPIFPGVTAAYNGVATYHAGILDPTLGGAWAQYTIGQYTQFSGIEPIQEGKVHFAGEGTSMDFQGFMEGGVRTGERVANEIHNAP